MLVNAETIQNVLQLCLYTLIVQSAFQISSALSTLYLHNMFIKCLPMNKKGDSICILNLQFRNTLVSMSQAG